MRGIRTLEAGRIIKTGKGAFRWKPLANGHLKERKDKQCRKKRKRDEKIWEAIRKTNLSVVSSEWETPTLIRVSRLGWSESISVTGAGKTIYF